MDDSIKEIEWVQITIWKNEIDEQSPIVFTHPFIEVVHK